MVVRGAAGGAGAEAGAEACASVEVWPVRTNAAFLAKCASHPDFVDGAVDTGFIEARLEELTERTFSDEPAMAAIGWRLDSFLEAEARPDPWGSGPAKLLGFRMNADRAAMTLPMAVDGKPTPLRVALLGGGTEDWSWDIRHADGRTFDEVARLPTTYGKGPIHVFEGGDVQAFDFEAHVGGPGEGASSDGAILSPMPGKIVSVAVSAGQTVSKGQTLLTLEAMKMEHALVAPFDGVVAELSASAGGQVSEGVVLVKLEGAA